MEIFLRTLILQLENMQLFLFFCSCTYIQHTKPYDWLALLSTLFDEHRWTPECTTLSTRPCTAISHCGCLCHVV